MACDDVLSLERLQISSKHDIFHNEVITGKAGGVAGGANIGTATNPVTGQTQQTLPSILADLGFDVQSWTSSTGGVLASANQVFLNDTPGSLGLGDYYAWGGPFPKTVPAGTDPALPGGGYIVRSSRFAGTQAREALRRSYAEAGYNLVDGSFEAGGTLVNANDVLLQERTGKAFSGPAGTVAAGTNPASGGFVDRSDRLLNLSKLAVSIKEWGAKVDGVTDDTDAFIDALQSGARVLAIPATQQGVMVIRDITHTLTGDLKIINYGCEIKLVTGAPVNSVIHINTNGFNLTIDDIDIDANNLAYKGLSVQNETNTTLADVNLNAPHVSNVYRSGTAFLGGDGIWIRGGYRRVHIVDPVVKSVKMAAGAGIPNQQGVFGISVLQNFAQTLMPRFVVIDNPYVEDIFSEDPTYTQDQDGLRGFGIESPVMDEGSFLVNGGTFKNCWGRSMKFQRPDATVRGSTFVRTTGNSSGGGNSEIDFQRGGGVVRDIICNYKDFNPVTIVSSYQNAYETRGLLVDGVDVTLSGTTLTQVAMRYSQATPDKPIPIDIKNIKVNGAITRLLRYLTQNSVTTDEIERVTLENISIGDAQHLVQVYGNNTPNQTAAIYTRNCATTGANVDLLDVGTFSNAIKAVLYEENNSGFNGINTDSFYTPTLTPQSGSITLNSSESRLDYTRQGRLVTVIGQIRVASVSAPTGTLKISLPKRNQLGTQTSNWSAQPIIMSGAVSVPANGFAIIANSNTAQASIIKTSGIATEELIADQVKTGTRLYINFTYKTDE